MYNGVSFPECIYYIYKVNIHKRYILYTVIGSVARTQQTVQSNNQNAQSEFVVNSYLPAAGCSSTQPAECDPDERTKKSKGNENKNAIKKVIKLLVY